MRILKALWAGFKAVGLVIGNVVARVVLTAFYYLLLTPFALIARARIDPLRLKRSAAPAWIERPVAVADLAAARQQF
jgi:hypothetical protein